MFNPGGQDGFMTQPNQGQPQIPVKAENGVENHSFNGSSETHENFFSGLYSHPSTYGEDSGAHHLSGFANWNMDLVQNDPLQSKADALLTYVFSNRTPTSDSASDEMRRCLTVDNIKHFVEQFTSFQGHWPIVHMPTFNPLEANEALFLTIICVGAIYSDKCDVHQTRAIMELVKDAVKSSSRVYGVHTNAIPEGDQPIGSTNSDIEEIQALAILQIVFSWHGNPTQRSVARQEFGTVVSIARRMGLAQPVPPEQPGYSLLHQPGQIPQTELSSWNWNSWVQQEKDPERSLVMFFNNPPQFDPLEIRLPLPADDVAWDAKTASDCSDALGLRGLTNQMKNVTGSRRPRQPDMRSAMRSLMDPNYVFQPRATNAYSKFIMIHALLSQIWKAQRVNFQQQGGGPMNLGGLITSGPSTPLSQNDWLLQSAGNSSAVTTPTDGFHAHSAQALSFLKSIHMALSKWRQCWEVDLALQYPSDGSVQRRFGFSRDAIHFYYLGQSFLRSTNPNDWTSPPDVRFTQVMTLLKRIKGFVVNDNQRYGRDIGSVGDIDDNYGVGDLTLDMKLLFKPYNANTDSPVIGIQTKFA
ncbi:hypothetical protein H2203_001553 [Taxawa tesnikishii (nom. ined.)]|nr:hypothetical protein H2203_001553 [Dothideales sp. JES 119]